VNSELFFSGGATTAALTVKASPRAKVMRLRVDPRTGAVLLTVPKRVSRKKAVEWAAGHRLWVEEALARIPAHAPIGPGATIPYLGLPHAIDWSADRPRSVRAEQGRLIAGGPIDALEPRLVRWLKQQARTLLERETREFAAKAGVAVTRVGIGDPVSRWGSCSASGAIRYSWRLILAPEWVRRATVAHEVAHRVHMNHGPQFHALVKQLFGADPAPARQWLKREGAALHRIGRSG
jgi:predicted metal-dependent hydrolase